MTVRSIATILLLFSPIYAAQKCLSQDTYHLNSTSYKVESTELVHVVNDISIKVRISGYMNSTYNTPTKLSESIEDDLVSYVNSIVLYEPKDSSRKCQCILDVDIDSKPVPNRHNVMSVDYNIDSFYVFAVPETCSFANYDKKNIYIMNNFDPPQYKDSISEVRNDLRILMRDFLSKTEFILE